jgi:predicted RNA-binding Zn-ribbon protein involved in translation (DUF1610 family)
MTTVFPVEEPNATYTTCPRCGENTLRSDRPVMNALSRTDNKTYVCSPCGTAEALEDFASNGTNLRSQTNWKALGANALKMEDS